MRLRLQTSFFGGDTTFIDDTSTEFDSLSDAVAYIRLNKPPSDFEWNVREIGENGKAFGSAVAWTRYGGDEISYWEYCKICKIK